MADVAFVNKTATALGLWDTSTDLHVASGMGGGMVIEPDKTSADVLGVMAASGEVHVANPHLWEPAPGVPYLYTARVRFGQDEYSQPFGIREIKVDGCRFLINGKPFHFHGPCKHEDSLFLHELPPSVLRCLCYGQKRLPAFSARFLP